MARKKKRPRNRRIKEAMAMLRQAGASSESQVDAESIERTKAALQQLDQLAEHSRIMLEEVRRLAETLPDAIAEKVQPLLRQD